MKIIGIDNFDRENFSDILVCENVNEGYGRIITNMLNTREGSGGDRFYKLVRDDHKLYIFEP